LLAQFRRQLLRLGGLQHLLRDGIGLAVGLSVAVVWAGLLLDCATGRPATFWITAIFFIVYLAAEAWCRVVRRE